jgi:DNA damage-binding protein 1
MSLNYVVTAYPSQKVIQTCVARFTGPKNRNLLVARVTHIDVYDIGPHGLVLFVRLPVYARIAGIMRFRRPKDAQDSVVLFTSRLGVAILSWNQETAQCVTVLTSDDRDDNLFSTVSERRPLCKVDPSGRCIGVSPSRNHLRIIPTQTFKNSLAFLVRLPADEIIDMVFLHGCKMPTIAVLLMDSSYCVHLRSFEIHIQDQDILPGLLDRDNLDANGMSLLIPMEQPFGAVIVIADQAITCIGPQDSCVSETIAEPSYIRAIGQVDDDGSRYLLGDDNGKLSMLSLDLDPNLRVIHGVRLDAFGETSTACAISYLDKGFVFIGSETGNSQLIKLKTQPDPETKSLCEVVHSYPHIGPITDFCIVKGSGNLRQGQGQVVTCSGIQKDGSLRIMRNGIGIIEQAALDLTGIKDLWALRRHSGDRFHAYLVQSFAFETRVLEVNADEISEIVLPCLDIKSATLFAANLIGDMIIQVTASGIHLLDCASMNESLGTVWKPPEGSRILVAAGNASQLLLSISSGDLVYLEAETGKKTMVVKSSIHLDLEVACLNCNPLGPLAENGTAISTSTTMAAVGLWADINLSPTVKLFALPSLAPVCTIALDGDVMARSLLFATLGGQDYLLIALGDGHLLTYVYSSVPNPSTCEADSAHVENGIGHEQDAAKGLKLSSESNVLAQDGVIMYVNGVPRADAGPRVLTERHRLSVGTQPAALSLFCSRGANHVFAACDRPKVVYADRGGNKLLISNVNQEQVTRVCGFDNEAAPDCLAIATDSLLQIGAVDEIQKLHIQTVALGQQPRRIAHMESAGVFVVITESTRLDEDGDERIESFICLFDDLTFEKLEQSKVQDNEVASAVTTTTFQGEGMDPRVEYCVVGTAIDAYDDSDASLGRILLFVVVDKRLTQVAEHPVCGAVYDMAPFNGRLLAGVNMRALVLSVKQGVDGILKIKQDISHRGHILIWRLQAQGDFVVLGDIMQSITLLTGKSINGDGLEQLAADYDLAWTTALEIMEDDTFMLAEQSCNLLTLRRNSSAASDVDRWRLDRVGLFHLGAIVNRIKHGSLVMRMPEDVGSPVQKTMIFGTADGMLGVIATLTPAAHEFFVHVEKAMASELPGVGGFSHADWRQFYVAAPLRKAPAKGFVDGDLVERFLELPLLQATRVADTVGVTVEDLTRRVEEMHRLH